CEAPHYPADDIQASKPKFPSVQVPPQLHPKLVTQEGEDIDWGDPFPAKAYAAELERIRLLNSQAALLHETFLQKYGLAEEAHELMEISLGELALRWRAVREDFERAQTMYEQECRKATAPIKSVQQEYLSRTLDGVRGHFELSLRTMSLPLPDDYHGR